MSVIAWFFYGQRDQKPTEGESAGGQSTAWGEPSPAVASAPHCVWGLGITWDHRKDLPFCLAQATTWSWKGGRGLCLRRLLALRFGDVVSLSPGAAWLCAACLEGFLLLDPTVVPWAGELGQGDVGKRWRSRGMRVPTAWAFSEPGTGSDSERGRKDTCTPGVCP